MSNALMVSGSYVDDSIAATPLAASSAATNFGVDNLLNTVPSFTWRTGAYTAGNVVYLTIDTGDVTERAVNAVVLYNHNLTNAGQYRLRAYTDATEMAADTTGDGTASVYGGSWLDVGDAPTIGYSSGDYGLFGYGGYGNTDWQRYKYLLVTLATPVYCQFWKLFLTDISNSDGYIEGGRLMVSRYYQPEVNFDWGYGFEWVDPSIQTRTRSGVMRTESRNPYRKVDVNYGWMSDLDFVQVNEIERLTGKRKDVFWQAYPDDSSIMGNRNAFLGRLTNWRPLQRQRQGYQFGMTIEELI